MGALIMLGTLGGLIVLIFALVLRFDPQTRSPQTRSPQTRSPLAQQAADKRRVR